MSAVLKKSLAAWQKEHGFGILCIVSPNGEQFLVGPSEEMARAADQFGRGDASWAALSESQLRQYLAERDFSDSDTDEAIHLSREWATTITGASVFPAPATRS